MLLAIGSIVVGSAFPASDLGSPRAFEGRWVLVAPPAVAAAHANLAVEGFVIKVVGSNIVGNDAVLVNPKGRVVRVWGQPVSEKLPGFMRDWLSGSSVNPGLVAPDPRLVVKAVPALPRARGVFSSISWAIRSVNPSSMSAGIGSRGLLVLFLSSSGPVDAIYRDRIDAIAAKCSERQVDVLGLFPGKLETASSIASMRLPFPCALDEGNGFADAYRAICTPEVFLLDSKQHVVYTGAIDSSTWGGEAAVGYLSLAIDALASAKLPTVSQTMPFGTSIER